jgi:hypothetical protein
VVGDLRGRGFADGTILINLNRLVQGGYATIGASVRVPIIPRLRR